MAAPMTDEQMDRQLLLMTAVAHRNVSLIHKLLKTDEQVDVNKAAGEGKTPLAAAVAAGFEDVVAVLLDHGADPCESYALVGSQGKSYNQPPIMKSEVPLRLALTKGSSGKMVQLLMQAGADLSAAGFTTLDALKTTVNQLTDADELTELLLERLEQESPTKDKYKSKLSDILLTSVGKGNHKLLNILLRKGADPNCRIPGRDVPVLVIAANENRTDMCKSLLDAGASLNNVPFVDDNLPLISAVEAGMVDAVQTLIDLGAKVNVYSHLHRQKLSLLHIAVAHRNVAITKLLLDAGAEIMLSDEDESNPLHTICQKVSPNQHEILKLLLRKAPIEIISMKNKRGKTPLLLACENHCVELVSELLHAGADPNVVDSGGESAMLYAIRTGSDTLVQLLLDSSADVNAKRRDGLTPLLSAVCLRDFLLTELLIEYGADVTCTEATGKSALHLAVGHEGCVHEDDPEYLENMMPLLELLIQHNDDINIRTDFGSTPLMLAAKGCPESVCELLIQNGAGLNLTDYNQSETALLQSVYFGREDNASLLIKHGADVNLADQVGLTPLYWAFFNNRAASLILLVIAGADLRLADLHHKYPRNLSVMKNEPLVSWLTDMLGRPRQLQQLCRLCLRRTLARKAMGCSILKYVQQLTLPERLQNYLLFATEVIPDFSSHELS